MAALGEVLKKLREAKKMSKKEVTDATGLSSATYNGLENGQLKNPNLKTLMALADYFGTTIDELNGNKRVVKQAAKYNNHLSTDEDELIKLFRDLTVNERSLVFGFMSVVQKERETPLSFLPSDTHGDVAGQV